MADISVTHVGFGERGVEVSYVEERDQGEKAALYRTVLVDGELVAAELAEILDLLQDVVDKAIESIHNPPEQLPGKREYRP